MMYGPALGRESTAHQGGLGRGGLLSLLCHRETQTVFAKRFGTVK